MRRRQRRGALVVVKRDAGDLLGLLDHGDVDAPALLRHAVQHAAGAQCRKQRDGPEGCEARARHRADRCGDVEVEGCVDAGDEVERGLDIDWLPGADARDDLQEEALDPLEFERMVEAHDRDHHEGQRGDPREQGEQRCKGGADHAGAGAGT